MALIVIPRRVPWRSAFSANGATFTGLARSAVDYCPVATAGAHGNAINPSNTGILVGSPLLKKGHYGIAYDLDGVNDDVQYSTLGGINPSTGQFTISIFVNWTGSGGLLLRDDTVTGGTFFPWESGGTVRYRIGGATYDTTLTASNYQNRPIRWTLVVGAGTAKLYADDVLLHSGSAATEATVSPWHMGRNGKNQNYTSAIHYEIAFWDYALTDSDVIALGAAGRFALWNPRTQRIFIPSGGTKTATLILDDKDSNIVANATGIRWAWFDQMPGSSMAAPTDKGAVETTDGSGSLSVDIPNSTLTSGQTGYYAISNSDGTIATNHLQGGGPAKVD